MADMIKGAGETYQKDLFGDLKLSTKEALALLEALNETLKKTGENNFKGTKIDPKTLKDFDKLNEALGGVNKTYEESIKVKKEKLQLQQKIDAQMKQEAKSLEKLQANLDNLKRKRTALNKEEKKGLITAREANKQRSELNVLIKASSKNLNDAQKQILKSSDAYTELKDNTNAAQINFKKLAAELGVNSKEAKDALLQFEKLDAELRGINGVAKDGRRDIGRYADGIKEAEKSTGRLSGASKKLKGILKGIGIGAIIAVVTKLGSAFGSSRRGQLAYAKGFNKINAAVKVFISTVTTAAPAMVSVLSGVFTALTLPLTSLINLFKAAALAMKGDFSGAADLLSNSTSKMIESIKSIPGEVKKVMKEFDGFAERVNKTNEGLDALTANTLKYTIEIENLERALAKTRGEQELANAIADDATLSFNERIKAISKVAELNTKVAEQEEGIAKKRFDLAKEDVKAALTSAGVQVNSTEDIIKALNDLDNVKKLSFETQGKALDISDEQSRAFTDSFIALEDAKIAASNARFDQEKKKRELNQDLSEKDLDILIDGFDNQKTINEKIIESENESFENRRKTLDELKELSDGSFNKQIEALQMFTDKTIDANDLINESDAVALNKKIRNLGLSEILEGRLLEVIRDKKTANSDLKISTDELNRSERDALDLKEDIAAQEEALRKQSVDGVAQNNKAFEDLEKQREDNEIKSIERKLKRAQKGSAEELKLQNELNDLLLKKAKEKADKEEAFEKWLAEKKKEIQRAALNKLDEAMSEASDRRIEALDEEVQATEKQQDRLRDLADKGVLDADKSLAAEEKKEAELKRQKEREEIKQERISAGFKILSALLEQGKSPQEAIPEVGVLLGVLPEIINALPTFYEGTDTTISQALGAPNLSSGKDGYLIRADKDEAILNPDKTKRMGIGQGRTTEEATSIVENYDKGMFGTGIDMTTFRELQTYNEPKIDPSMGASWQSNEQILNKFESLQRATEVNTLRIEKAINSKPVLTDVTYNKLLNIVEYTTRENNKIMRRKSKLRIQ